MTEKTILITGASAGFGEATAKRFAKEGNVKLILAARRHERLEALAAQLNVPTHIWPLDIQDKKAIKEGIKTLPEAFKNIDVLVNNAGLALGTEPAEATLLDDWETMVDTNIKGLITLTREVLPLMVANKRGHVVNIGSIAGNWPYPGGNVYGATKAFVRQFSLNLRADMQGKNVRVTNIEPGLAETEFSIVRYHGDTDKADNVYQNTQPLTADDVAESVYWATNQPKHVNINSIELMPTAQAFGPLAVHREE